MINLEQYLLEPDTQIIKEYMLKQYPDLFQELKNNNDEEVFSIIDQYCASFDKIPLSKENLIKKISYSGGYTLGIAVLMYLGTPNSAPLGISEGDVKQAISVSIEKTKTWDTKKVFQELIEDERDSNNQSEIIPDEYIKNELSETLELDSMWPISNTQADKIKKEETMHLPLIETVDANSWIITTGETIELDIQSKSGKKTKDTVKAGETIERDQREYTSLKHLNDLGSIPKNTSIALNPESVKNFNAISEVTFPSSLKETIQSYPTYDSFTNEMKERIKWLWETVENFYANEYDILRSTYHQKERVIPFDLMFAYAAIESKRWKSEWFAQNNIFNIQWKWQSDIKIVKGYDYSQDYNTGKKTAMQEENFTWFDSKEDANNYFLEYIEESRFYWDHLKNSSDKENPYMASAILKTWATQVNNSTNILKPKILWFATDILRILKDTENLEKFRYIFTWETPKQIYITVPPAGSIETEVERAVDQYFKKQAWTFVSKNSNINDLTSSEILSKMNLNDYTILPNWSKMYKAELWPAKMKAAKINTSKPLVKKSTVKKKPIRKKKATMKESKDIPHSFDFKDWLDSIEVMSQELKRKTIILDPWHGWIDGGGAPYIKNWVGKKVRLIESAIALDVCYRLAKIIKEKGWDVHITHYSHSRGISNNKDLTKVKASTDIYSDTEKSWDIGAGKTIKYRKDFTNELLKKTNNESFFFSIHADVARELNLPMIAYFFDAKRWTDKDGRKFVKSLTKEMNRWKWIWKWAKTRGKSLWVISSWNKANNKTLIELWNMKNSSNAWNMRTWTWRQKYAEAIAIGLVKHVEK